MQLTNHGVAPVADRRGLSAVAYGFIASKALFAALELDLFTSLARGPRTVDELVASTGVPPNRMRTLLHGLAAIGLVVAGCDGYANAPACERYLVRGGRQELGEYLRLQVGRQIYPALTHLDAGLAGTGGAFDTLTGLLTDPDEARTFTTAQHAGSLAAGQLLARRLDLTGARTLLDVGGGSGAFSIALCAANPGLRATVLDLPAVLAVAADQRAAAGLTDRIALLPGNALDAAWPGEQDVVLMSYLLSALDADDIDAVLTRAHAGLRPGGLLVRARLRPRRRRPGTGVRRSVVPAVPRLPRARCQLLRRRAGRPVARPRFRRPLGRRPHPRDHEGGPEPEESRAMTGTIRPLAVGVTPMETRHDLVLHLADRAEELGYDAFYLAEGWGHDAAVLLAAIAARTRRIRVGTGVINVWGRSAAGIAMLAASLDAVSSGRFVLGLGSGSPQLAEGLHDRPFHSPVAHLEAVTRQVRALLAGERATPSLAGEHKPMRLAVEPRPDVPVHLAALGPEAVRLAGELADGWYPFLLPRCGLEDGLKLLHEGAARANRRDPVGRPRPAGGGRARPGGGPSHGRLVGGDLPDRDGARLSPHPAAARSRRGR